MRFNYELSGLLAGSAIAIVIFQPLQATALTGAEINEVARQVTVLILGKDGNMGSGVIISRNGNTYYVLTANHVVKDEQEYKIVTHDQQKFELQNAKPFPNDVDLAVVEFTSDNSYEVAKLAKSDAITPGTSIFISGWPKPGQVESQSKQLVRQFSSGSVSAILPQPVKGYQMGYDNTTVGGMSGGPVFDAGGRVVAIHGLGNYDLQNAENLQASGLNQDSIKELARTGFNYGIPINTFLQLAPQANLYVSLNVESAAPPEPGQPVAKKIEGDDENGIDVEGIFNDFVEDKIREGLGRIRLPFF